MLALRWARQLYPFPTLSLNSQTPFSIKVPEIHTPSADPTYQSAIMATLSLTPNYSVYAIPAFWVLCMAPQFYGNILITKANNGNFDNTNPRYVSTLEPSPCRSCFES